MLYLRFKDVLRTEDEEKNNILMIAAKCGHKTMLEDFLRFGININTQNVIKFFFNELIKLDPWRYCTAFSNSIWSRSHFRFFNCSWSQSKYHKSKKTDCMGNCLII